MAEPDRVPGTSVQTSLDAADRGACTDGVVVPQPQANPGLVLDCKILFVIRDTLAGAADLNWDADRTISKWDGVVLGGSPPRIHELALSTVGLSGSIPAAIGELAELTRLDLSQNHITGPIPAQIGRLARLTELYLNSNELSGHIPVELGGLSELQILYLFGNSLTGRIPTELGQLSKLTSLVPQYQ